jgi:hypothetical protein
MTAKYDKLGLQFLYPENWSILEEERDDWPHRVTVQSPGSAYWELQVYPSRTSRTKLTAEVLKVMQEEYEDLESQVVTDEICQRPAIGYDLSFFCLDFLVTSRIRCLCVDKLTYLLIYQAESREFDRQHLVFEAITQSLLTETPASQGSGPEENP